VDDQPVDGPAPPPDAAPARRGTELRTFLIADIRGYTSYTEEHGDEPAAELAASFASLVEEVAGEFEGILLEVRGDEALAVFFSARQALRAAVALQSRSGSLARPIGIGLDAGEAIPVGAGYRGTALNVAARLCAGAKGGEIVASEAVIHMAARIDGVAYVDPRSVRLKGLEEPVRAVSVLPESQVPRGFARTAHRARRGIASPRALVPIGGIALATLAAGALLTGMLGPGPFGPTAQPSSQAVASPRGPADFAVTPPTLALLDATTGDLVTTLLSRAPGDWGTFAEGAFWQLETEPPGILRIDAASGSVTTISAGVREPGGFAVDGTNLWITDRSGPRLVRISTISGEVVEELRLTVDRNDTRGATDVAVGGGSVWVTRPGAGQLIRLDAETGDQQRTIPISGEALAVDADRVWILDPEGRIAWVDVATNAVSSDPIVLPRDDYRSLEVGDGYLWTAGSQKGIVYRIDPTGRVDAPYRTGAGARTVSFADGRLWVGNQVDGTVSAIDALTEVVTTYDTGHTVAGVVAGDGRLLVGVVPTEDPYAALQGRTLRMAVEGDPLAVFDPPLIATWPMFQVANATCASLLRYPDKPAPDGWVLEPEIAAELPTVSDDGETYTFRIREGFAFSPPSNEPVTAATIHASLERALSGEFGAEFSYASGLLQNVEGVSAFNAGLTDHVEGLMVEGDRLTIHLQADQADFLHRLAMPHFCPVPIGTPIVENGLNPAAGLPSAGPYYLSRKDDDVAILTRNPNYHGPRAARYDNIGIELGQDVTRAIARIQAGQLDYVQTDLSRELWPDGGIAATTGPKSPLGGTQDQRYFNVATGVVWYLHLGPRGDRGSAPLSELAVRQAIALAVDRPRIAAALGSAIPTDNFLPPRVPGYARRDLLPLDGPDVDRARELLGERSFTLDLVHYAGCDKCAAAMGVVAENLAAIGLEPVVRAGDPLADQGDIGMFVAVEAVPDPARFLDALPTSGLTDVGFEEFERVGTLGPLVGEERSQAAAALLDRWSWEIAIMSPVAAEVTGEYFGPGVGCQVEAPAVPAIDLVTLCPT
jgi:ABC-type transport system substrate-binding protein/class 3 adenylate cyclase/outer membrane protein assembly factor BamB